MSAYDDVYTALRQGLAAAENLLGHVLVHKPWAAEITEDRIRAIRRGIDALDELHAQSSPCKRPHADADSESEPGCICHVSTNPPCGWCENGGDPEASATQPMPVYLSPFGESKPFPHAAHRCGPECREERAYWAALGIRNRADLKAKHPSQPMPTFEPGELDGIAAEAADYMPDLSGDPVFPDCHHTSGCTNPLVPPSMLCDEHGPDMGRVP